MRYLSVSDVLFLHRLAVDFSPSDEPIFDFGLLESAVMRPQQTVGGSDAYIDIHHKAAALMHSLCRNHPFADGNKRTALVCVGTFYEINGYRFSAEEIDMVGLSVDVAEGLLDVATIAGVLKNWNHPA